MVFSAIADFVYKEVPTFTKLNQILANIVAHDHRADGSQGAPLVGEWVDATEVVTDAAGWNVTRFRYLRLLGGKLVAYDVALTKASPAVTIGASGNVATTTLLTGIPEEARVPTAQGIVADAGGGFSLYLKAQPAGTLTLEHGTPGGDLTIGFPVTATSVLWRT